MKRPKIAVVTSSSGDGAVGGAERLFQGLRAALLDEGFDAALVPVLSDESGIDAIKASYLRCYDLDLSMFDGVVSTKAPTYAVRHPNHVCYLMHTMRVFYDMFGAEFGQADSALRAQRAFIQSLDTASLGRQRCGGIFSVGEEVARRLYNYNGLTAVPLRHPTTLAGLHRGEFRHLLLPGRLHRWKRVDLAIAAMAHVSADVELLISGTGEDAPALHAAAAGDPRIRFLGKVSDAELVELYAQSLAVLFVPRREDLGLVTLEAFGSGKPVITCEDSGEPARIVEDGVSGFVCSPDPVAIAERIDRLAAAPTLAREMGERGALAIAGITWRNVAGTLATALRFTGAAA